MNIWERLIADTIQMGGVLIFLRDQAPGDLSQWISSLQTLFAGEIPVVLRSAGDLQQGKFKTRSEDLIFFFESQTPLVSSLNSVLQGQRILLSKGLQPRGVDFVWADASLQVWNETLRNLKNNLMSVKPLHENHSTQETACLFLDRDDVVVKNVPYNNDPSKVKLMPGVVELIQKAHAKGYWVALVTNQSGLGRGRISWTEYKKVHQRMLELLAAQNCWIDESVWASFIENEAVVEGRLLASLRKPRAGMFQLVHDKLRVKMSESFMVGDSATDLMAAHAAGVKHLCLFHSDKFVAEENSLREYQKAHPDFQLQVLKNLKDLLL